MIRITRSEPPIELNEAMVKKFTEKYMNELEEKKLDKKQKLSSVWNQKYIKNALNKMSHYKCAYCETILDSSGNYMEIEHFYPKSLYPDKVVDWDNLLPSCKRCNINKGDHDPMKLPIINPSEDEPSKHLKVKLFRLIAKDSVGESTIDLLELNDLEKLLQKRTLVYNQIYISLKEIFDNLPNQAQDINESKFYKKSIKTRNCMVELLKQVQPDKNFSGILSSYFFKENEYDIIKEYLVKYNLWNEELIELEKIAKKITLEIT